MQARLREEVEKSVRAVKEEEEAKRMEIAERLREVEEAKKILEDAIGGEDKRKPLPDEKLAELLNSKGYNIARRTVAKYREQLNIPVARLRKEV